MMAFFRQALVRAEFLDAISELKDNLLKLGSVPYDSKVYDYALRFFTILKQFDNEYKIDRFFFETSDKLSQQALSIFLFRNWIRTHIRVPYKDEITLNKVYLSSEHFSLKDYQDRPDQPVVQKNIQDDLIQMRNKFLKNIEIVSTNTKRPNNLVLKIAGYQNQKSL
jgi:hypothetical protein